MSTYKVIQDIEAEDHILGPLSLRQFIFALIAALCFYLCYIVVSKGAGFLVVLFLPPGLFCAFFAAPFGKDQPTEVWALAKIRFFFKPRKRIWDQSGVKDLVSITVPKKVEVRRTDGLSQTEVKSRLAALATTIDSRGWAVKNVDLNLYAQPGFLGGEADSDRLVQASTIPQAVPAFEVNAADDIMDAANNPIAQQFDQMITASTQAHHQQLVDMLQQPGPTGANLPAPVEPTNTLQTASQGWFMQQATPQMPVSPSVVPTIRPNAIAYAPPAATLPEPPIDEAAVTQQLRANEQKNDVVYGHMKTIQPIGSQKQPVPPPAPVKPQPNPATSQLAARNDLNISTIARVANKTDLPSDEEVIIPLH